MINFFSSTLTWKSPPWTPDEYYKWAGGFVGKWGQTYHVRFNLEGRCLIRDPAGNGEGTELFLGAPCRSEYTIAERNLFQVPSSEWRMAFSREQSVAIARRPRWEPEMGDAKSLAEAYPDYRIDIRRYSQFSALDDEYQIVQATLDNDLLGARSTYENGGLEVTVEFPVNLINVNARTANFRYVPGR